MTLETMTYHLGYYIVRDAAFEHAVTCTWYCVVSDVARHVVTCTFAIVARHWACCEANTGTATTISHPVWLCHQHWNDDYSPWACCDVSSGKGDVATEHNTVEWTRNTVTGRWTCGDVNTRNNDVAYEHVVMWLLKQRLAAELAMTLPLETVT